MRKLLLPIATLLIFASCSTQKYAYHFDHYDYAAGKKKSAVVTEEVMLDDIDFSLSDASLTASLESEPALVAEKPVAATASAGSVAPAAAEVETSYKDMSKAERKAFRKEAKTLIKNYVKAVKSGDEVKAKEAAKAMDSDLRMAAIFGAVGIVSLIIGGDVFWVIGAIALIIGVVFFVLWLTRQ